MSSPDATSAALMTLHTAGQSSCIASIHSGCVSRSHAQRSVNRAPFAMLSGVAWKSLALLNGGSVAIRCTVPLFMPRRNVRLSPWNSVRLRKLICAMLVASCLYVRGSVVLSGFPFSKCVGLH